MYSYYNYLLLESSREELNQLDPKFRQIRYNVDNTTDDLLLALDNSTEVMRAALEKSTLNPLDDTQQMSFANHHSEIVHRYSNSELVGIFKKLGRFVHPKDAMEHLKIKENDKEIFNILLSITNDKPNVVLENLKGLHFPTRKPHSVLLDDVLKEIGKAMNHRV